jgi:hypothetical protein
LLEYYERQHRPIIDVTQRKLRAVKSKALSAEE